MIPVWLFSVTRIRSRWAVMIGLRALVRELAGATEPDRVVDLRAFLVRLSDLGFLTSAGT